VTAGPGRAPGAAHCRALILHAPALGAGALTAAMLWAGQAAAQDCERIHLAETLPEYARLWDTTLNRDGRGRPLVPDYARAAELLAANRTGAALLLLDRTGTSRSATALRSGAPGMARVLARLIRACRDWLPLDQEAPSAKGAALPGPRRKPSASPRVFLEHAG
jgi:hypothetical protein